MPGFINGAPGNDTIIGGSGDDTIIGGAGNDRLVAGWGDDVVFGGKGNNSLAQQATYSTASFFYGNDLNEQRDPIEAGLGWCCREATGFIGADEVARVRAQGPAQRLAAFVMEGPGIARQGNPVSGGGEVTSGTFSPCLERGIGMAYIPAARAEPGTHLEIDVRGRMRAAVIVPKPIYKK